MPRPSAAILLRSWMVVSNLGTNASQKPLRDWPIYIGTLPDSPDNLISIYDTTPIKDGRMMSGETIIHPGIQIRVRSRGYTMGFDRLASVIANLDNLKRVQISYNSDSYLISSFQRTSDPLPLGVDPDNRLRQGFTVNGTVSLQLLN